MRDYDKPKPPANTPPVIEPGVKPNSSAEGTKKDEVPARGTGDNDKKVEKALRNAQDGGRDGAGEAALDSPQPD